MLENKKILVTGGLGFIGSHFVELLLETCSDCMIDIIDVKDYCVSEKTETLLRNKAEDTSNHLDVFEENIVYWEFEETYDYVINFAAQSHVDRSIEDGNEFVMTNVVGTHNLLNQFNGTRFIQVGTDEVYGSLTSLDRPSLESDLLAPSSVYSSSKASADLIALSFFHTHKKDVVVTRCTNNFGPRQYPEKLIPVIVDKIENNEKIPVYGTGENIRQWIYVKDHAQQILSVMMNGIAGEIYNIAPSYTSNSEITNIDIVNKIINICGSGEIEYVTDRKGHDMRYSLNGSKTRRINIGKDELLLPGLEKTFDSDLEYTIMWYKENKDWWYEKTSYN